MVSVEYEIDRGGIETTAKDEVFTEGLPDAVDAARDIAGGGGDLFGFRAVKGVKVDVPLEPHHPALRDYELITDPDRAAGAEPVGFGARAEGGARAFRLDLHDDMISALAIQFDAAFFTAAGNGEDAPAALGIERDADAVGDRLLRLVAKNARDEGDLAPGRRIERREGGVLAVGDLAGELVERLVRIGGKLAAALCP